jgi:non-canonical poly(A) RNA polymerase PAPD5/7
MVYGYLYLIKTNLFFSSDMDLVVIGEWDTLPLHSLAQALLKNGVCNENIQVLDKASVSYFI